MAGQQRPNPVDGDERGGRSASSLSTLVHPTDLILAAVILAICAALYYATTRFDEVSPLFAQDIPPEFFPRMLIWTIVVLTLLLPFEHLFDPKRRKSLDEDRSSRIKPISFITAGLLCAVVLSIEWIGTALAMVLVCVLLPRLWGETRLRIIVPFALVFPGIVTLVFSNLLKVHFEPGVWEAIFS